MTADALIQALKDGGVLRVYATNEVPASPTYPYVVLAFSPAAPTIRTLDGSGDPAGRFTVQHFAESDDALDDLTAITFATFDGQELPLEHGPICIQQQATPTYRDPDDRGVLTITHIYEY